MEAGHPVENWRFLASAGAGSYDHYPADRRWDRRQEAVDHSDIDVTRFITEAINIFLANNLPNNALEYAGYGGIFGVAGTTTGFLANLNYFGDPDQPIVETSIDAAKRRQIEAEQRKQKQLEANQKRLEDLRKKHNCPP